MHRPPVATRRVLEPGVGAQPSRLQSRVFRQSSTEDRVQIAKVFSLADPDPERRIGDDESLIGQRCVAHGPTFEKNIGVDAGSGGVRSGRRERPCPGRSLSKSSPPWEECEL